MPDTLRVTLNPRASEKSASAFEDWCSRNAVSANLHTWSETSVSSAACLSTEATASRLTTLDDAACEERGNRQSAAAASGATRIFILLFSREIAPGVYRAFRRSAPDALSVTEQRDQDDDGNGNAKYPQKNGTHELLLITWPGLYVARAEESRSRPPNVAEKLAANAPINKETTSQSAVYADALRASSATCFALTLAWRSFCCSCVKVSVTRCSASACDKPVFAATSCPRYCVSAVPSSPFLSPLAKMRVTSTVLLAGP